MPTERKHLDLWLRCFRKSPELQQAWDKAVTQAEKELPEAKAKLQGFVQTYLQQGSGIAAAGEEILEYLISAALAEKKIVHGGDTVPSLVNRSLDIQHMHNLIFGIWRDGFALNKAQNAVVHHCVPGTEECEKSLGFRRPNRHHNRHSDY